MNVGDWAKSARVAAAIVCFACGAISSHDLSASTFVRMDFNLSLIAENRSSVFIELFDDRPVTRNNFLQYVEGGLYDNTVFHRLAPGFVLQGGGFQAELIDQPEPINVALDPDARVDLDGDPNTPNPNVVNEFSNSPTRSNTTGTIAMAKLGGNPDSATNQFFFNLSDNSANLDNQNGGFTVFAQVAGDGMNLIGAYGGLGQTNLNPDFGTYSGSLQISEDPDGVRDPLAFGDVPFLGSNLLVIDRADVVDYFAPDSTTDLTENLGINTETFVDSGATFTGSGVLNVNSQGNLGVRDGVSLGVRVVNGGEVSPGLSLGDFTTPWYTQTELGKLNIDLRDVTAGSEHDQVNSTGLVSLAGELNVNLIAGFTPTLGSEYTIITAGDTLSGTFDTVNLPDLDSDLMFDITYNADSVVLSIVNAIVAGDLNGDGAVNFADLSPFTLALTDSAGYDEAFPELADSRVARCDTNGDGGCNFGDLSGFTSLLTGGSAASSATVPIPEPGAGWLLLLGTMLSGGCRRRSA